MASHHYIGKGFSSDALREAATDPDSLSDTIAGLIEGSGLRVVGREAALFPGGGLTLVWILAESHLVLHYWAQEGFSTLDLHICDYESPNASKAEALRARLEDFCFVPSSSRWTDLVLEDPVAFEPMAPLLSSHSA